LTLDEPTGVIELDPPGNGAVSRADVAAVIAAVLPEVSTFGRTIRFGNGSGEGALPISEAVRA
jgi:hypothetical protein